MFKECLAFYRLAEKIELTPEKYKQELAAIGHYQVVDFINKWYAQPFFNIEDVMPLLYNWLDRSKFSLISIHLSLNNEEKFWPTRQLQDYVTNALVNYSCDKGLFIQKGDTLREYLAMEEYKDHMTPATFQKVQRLMTLHIMDSIKEFDTDKRPYVLDLIATMMNKTQYFPRSLVIQLVKRLGPSWYGSMADASEYDFEKIMNKKHIDEFDIEAIFINHGEYRGIPGFSANGISKERMQQIISKCTPEAKEYIRGFVYYSENDTKMEHLFMLSEDMTPMDLEYRELPWPAFVCPERVKDIRNRALRPKWQEMMNDFKIMPS